MFISDSNKTISDVLSEFEEDGCLAQYDQNGVSVDEIMITMFHPLIKHLLFPVLPRDIKSQSKLMRTNYFYCMFLHLREMPQFMTDITVTAIEFLLAPPCLVHPG